MKLNLIADVTTQCSFPHKITSKPFLLLFKALSMLEVAEKAGANRMLELMEEAGISEQLKEMDNFTIFLPTDEAFEVNHGLSMLNEKCASRVLIIHSTGA